VKRGAGTLLHATVTEVHRGGLTAEVFDRRTVDRPAPRFTVVHLIAGAHVRGSGQMEARGRRHDP
jgi:hypothetical protein